MANKYLRNSFPVLTEDTVTQAHANYCAEYGHATHTVDGVDTGVCPRCGESNADPFGNRAFYIEMFGEETVKEMTERKAGDILCQNCGEWGTALNNGTICVRCADGTENNTREVFPRVVFRDVQDAEMVVECLRHSTVNLGKKAAQAIKVWGTQRVLHAVNLEAVVMDGENNVADPAVVIKEIVEAMTQMLGMMEAVTAQLGVLYHGEGIPSQENAKYMVELLDFVTETRDYVGTVNITCDEFSKTGER